MIKQLEIAEYLKVLNEYVIIDVRSEGEYQQGHIPGAVNIPILNNEHRKLVGTCYKQKGREEAVHLGFELVGPRFAPIIDEVKKAAPEKKVGVYCWRGGMRSNIMAWMLGLCGFKVSLLKGGYKQFRRRMLETLEQDFKLVIIGGKTGSGKTDVIKALNELGSQVADLEGMAHHKGSAFGGLGQLPQPTQEQFENILGYKLYSFDPDKSVFLENESRLIGVRHIPNTLYDRMREARVLEIQLPFEARVKRIMNEYGGFSKEDLSFHTKRIEKRLGNLRMRQALEMLENNEREQWVRLMLEYYDSLYGHSNDKRDKGSITIVDAKDENLNNLAKEIVRSIN